MLSRLTIRWDTEMGCYRVTEPNWPGGVVVPAEYHDAKVKQLEAEWSTLAAQVEQAIGWCETGAEPTVAIHALRKFLRENPAPNDDADCPCGEPIGGPPCTSDKPCSYADGFPSERWSV